MASMTPIRIRGKRNAPKDQKWRAGKQRKATRPGSATTSGESSSARSTPSAGAESRRRRKKRDLELSQLEKLPTEVIQVIFEYSGNLDLPLASSRLATQLDSKHLHHSMTSTLLQPVLDRNVPTDTEIKRAMRLMNSRFFSWTFFQSWLRNEFERRQFLAKSAADLELEQKVWGSEYQEKRTWYQLAPIRSLPPPMKLLRGPFTQDRVCFLRTITTTFRPGGDAVDPLFAETAQEGLQQAVTEGARDTFIPLWLCGAQVDTELLCLAVIDSGCDKHVVESLVTRAMQSYIRSRPCDVDFLDPMLWSWAEKAQANGNDKGPWLKDLLKDAARRTNRKDSVSKDAT